MEIREKGEKIKLREKRAKKRGKFMWIERRSWFWPVITTVIFFAFAGEVIWLTGGFKPDAIACGVITGILGAVVCDSARQLRASRFKMMRLERRIKRVEWEMDRFIIRLLKGLRLPLKHIKEHSDQLEESCTQLRKQLLDIDFPPEITEQLEEPDWDKIMRSTQFVSQTAEQLDVFPKGLLRFGRLRKAAPDQKWIDMNSLIVSIVENMADPIEKSGAEIQMQDLPTCLGDKELIGQMFEAIIENAVRYLDPKRDGLVRIWGWTEKDKAIYCVKDNGIGIAEENYDKIFELFHYINPSIDKTNGIGLAVVGQVLKQHNGRVWVESEPGEGSTFSIALTAK